MSQTYSLIDDAHAQKERFDWGELHWYASGALSAASGLTVGRCILNAKSANPIHYHPNCEEVLHVLSGEIEHYIDGEGWFSMNAGDSITIPVNLKHGARNVGDGDAHLLIAFSSPERQTIGEFE
ncbi:MAG: cupin [Phycisphaeraceae bacterium]|nr:cupin [Phycisphaeraceae bacterium]